ncbi:hypothetical protein PIB30_004604 [Stylosanthes scabra]|uniref:Cystatin domain-containing protein n=1 Tax=Stylosanthes scabra TaxID=79078 RepID=A0ABU6Z473_9FABA|nr:hypothetical protein [Stylosanthes scabra]
MFEKKNNRNPSPNSNVIGTLVHNCLRCSATESSSSYSHVSASQGFLVPVIGGTIHGGIEPYDFTDESDKQLVTDLAKEALQFYNAKNKTSFEFDRIDRVNSQAVAGYVFYITFTGHSAGSNATKTFYGKVWKKFYDLGTIVKFCETDLECIP